MLLRGPRGPSCEGRAERQGARGWGRPARAGYVERFIHYPERRVCSCAPCPPLRCIRSRSFFPGNLRIPHLPKAALALSSLPLTVLGVPPPSLRSPPSPRSSAGSWVLAPHPWPPLAGPRRPGPPRPPPRPLGAAAAPFTIARPASLLSAPGSLPPAPRLTHAPSGRRRLRWWRLRAAPFF